MFWKRTHGQYGVLFHVQYMYDVFSASCLCTDCFYHLSSFLSSYTVNYVSSMIIQVKPVD